MDRQEQSHEGREWGTEKDRKREEGRERETETKNDWLGTEEGKQSWGTEQTFYISPHAWQWQVMMAGLTAARSLEGA